MRYKYGFISARVNYVMSDQTRIFPLLLVDGYTLFIEFGFGHYYFFVPSVVTFVWRTLQNHGAGFIKIGMIHLLEFGRTRLRR